MFKIKKLTVRARKNGLIILGSLSFLVMGVSCKRNFNQSAKPLIIGGELVGEEDFVYRSTVSLDIKDSPSCSGVLIDKRTILTAAHCLKIPPDSVTFGSRQGRNFTTRIGPSQFVRHPDWSSADFGSNVIDPWPKSPKNDIGLIVLRDDAPEWTTPAIVKLIGPVATGNAVWLAGFGRTEHPMEPRGQLRKVKVLIDAINDEGYEITFRSPDWSNKSSCHGDSGGPMFFAEADGSLTLIGVTSRGVSKETDCRDRGIYTDVRKFGSSHKFVGSRVRLAFRH